MLIIPVLDVRGGLVVRAEKGDRANYRPIATPLAHGAAPASVALGLRTLFPFPILYVADLDGIEHGTPDLSTQAALNSAWPGREIWIDDGTSEVAASDRSKRVLGSETLRDDFAIPRDAILSLDFKGEAFQGPRALLDDASLWPGRVIVMTLARVGSGEGPDFERLAGIIARAGGREVYAAGGVRDIADIEALREVGASGALIASALHNGKIKTGDLEEIAG